MVKVLLSICLFLTGVAFGQSAGIKSIAGKVTFVTSKNIYISFENTDGIKTEDTLYIKKQQDSIPAVRVKYLSARSAAGELITNDAVSQGDILIAKIKYVTQNPVIKSDTVKTITVDPPKEPKIILPGSRIIPKSYYGRFSVQTYSNLINNGGSQNAQNWRYVLSFDAQNIGNSGFSFSNYSYFSYLSSRWSAVKNNIWDNLKVYDLSGSYRFQDSSVIYAGRRLNPKTASAGAFDGIQYERYSGEYYYGVMAGSRPDIMNYGYNLKLFEYGAYAGREDRISGELMENGLGVFQQTYNYKTDRRFIYFQHRNSLVGNTSVFFSMEADLYKKESGKAKNVFSPTSIYGTIRYAPWREFSVNLSYDARKNLVYYEMYKSFVDSMISKSFRQGYRFGLHFLPSNYISTGGDFSYNNQAGDPKPARNYYIYFNHNKLPFIDAVSGSSLTILNSAYLEGRIISTRLSRSIVFEDIYASVEYRSVYYKYNSGGQALRQNVAGCDLSVNIGRGYFASLSYEGTFEDRVTYSRIFFDLTTRF